MDKNRLICTAVFEHVIHVIVPKTVSDDRQKVSTRSQKLSDFWSIFEPLRFLSKSWVNVDFCDLLDKLFHMSEKHQILKRYFELSYYICRAFQSVLFWLFQNNVVLLCDNTVKYSRLFI